VPIDLEARERRGLRLGVAGAVLAFLALTTVQAVAIRPYLPPDELYHVGYAASLLEGRLPTLTTPLPGDRVPLMPDDRRLRRVYVANHPPLFHALAAVPIGIGERLGAPLAGFLAARFLSVALAAAGAHPPWVLLGLAGATLLAALALLALALALARADRAGGGAGPDDPEAAPGVPQPPPAAPRVSSRA